MFTKENREVGKRILQDSFEDLFTCLLVIPLVMFSFSFVFMSIQLVCNVFVDVEPLQFTLTNFVKVPLLCGFIFFLIIQFRSLFSYLYNSLQD